MRDAQARLERFGGGLDQAPVRRLVPGDEALGRPLLLDLAQLLRIAPRLRDELRVLDLVLGREGHHHALGVEAAPARPPCDLVELANAQAAHPAAVELRERGEHHGVDGHVDAHAERVRAADDGQKPLLGKLLHEQPVARQHPCVMHAHPALQKPLERLAERRGEAGAAQRLLHLVALLFRGHSVARERLRRGQRRVLREMHEVQRRLSLAQGQLHRGLEGRLGVLVGQGHRARRIGDHVHVRARALLERARDGAHVAEGRAHEQKLRLRQREQRHLPRPAAVVVAEEMELVHGDAPHVGPLALAQRLVRKDLGRAAHHGRARVDVRVPRDHPHVLAAEDVHEVEELLAHERLDGGGVVRAPSRGHGHEAQAQGHERLARAGGRAQDHVVAHHERHERFLLMGPQLDAARGRPAKEAVEGGFGIEPGLGRGLALLGLPPGGRQAAERAVREGVAFGVEGCGRVRRVMGVFGHEGASVDRERASGKHSTRGPEDAGRDAASAMRKRPQRAAPHLRVAREPGLEASPRAGRAKGLPCDSRRGLQAVLPARLRKGTRWGPCGHPPRQPRPSPPALVRRLLRTFASRPFHLAVWQTPPLPFLVGKRADRMAHKRENRPTRPTPPPPPNAPRRPLVLARPRFLATKPRFGTEPTPP